LNGTEANSFRTESQFFSKIRTETEPRFNKLFPTLNSAVSGKKEASFIYMTYRYMSLQFLANNVMKLLHNL